MLFPMPEEVDRTWEAVAQGTARGELGIAAKVATDEGGGDRVPRLVCVYTADFADKKDVRRVLEGLVEMGLVKKRGVMGEERGVFYKCGRFSPPTPFFYEFSVFFRISCYFLVLLVSVIWGNRIFFIYESPNE